MKKFNLEIAEPCHENWDQMKKEERGRFCASCEKIVVDFTNMSDRQLAEFFKKPASSLCGRFQQSQLDRDIEIPRKRIPWIRYFFQFSLPAFLVSMKASAQGMVRIVDTTKPIFRTDCGVMTTRVETKKEEFELKGRVTAKGYLLNSVTIRIKGSDKFFFTDVKGEFILQAKKTDKLVFSYVGFEVKEIEVTEQPLEVSMNAFTSGEVIVVGMIKSKRSNPIPLIKKLMHSAFTSFIVYPNPVRSNSSIRIDTKKLSKGDYSISIFSEKGELVQQKKSIIESKLQLLEYSIGQITPGNYIISLTNSKTGKSYSEKIIVQ